MNESASKIFNEFVPVEAVEAGGKRGDSAEFLGRLLLSVALVALFYAVWLMQVPSAAEWTGRALRIAPRLSVFALSIFIALTLQGCWMKDRVILGLGLAAGVAVLWLHSSATQFEIVKLDLDSMNAVLNKSRDWARAEGRVFYHARPELIETGSAMLLVRFECALFAAIFLGTWIGRGALSAWHFITLLMFGAFCDVWINYFHVIDSTEPASLINALRLPFIPAIGGISGAPTFTDIFFISAVFESARNFRMHTLSLVLGALAGYCSGSFLGLEPSPAWTYLAMPLMTCGMLAAAWPDLKLDSTALGKMFLAVALLILMLVSLVTLRNLVNPLPERRLEEEHRIRDLALYHAPQRGGCKLARPLHSTQLMNVPMYS